MNIIKVTIKSNSHERDTSWSGFFNGVPTLAILYAVVTSNFDGHPLHILRATFDVIQATNSEVLKASLLAGNYLISVLL